MKVKLINNTNNLTLNREYLVLGIEANYFRLINDEGKPYLYNPDLFVISESQYPTFWKCNEGEDNEKYCYPNEWCEPGFFEDYFDNIESAVKIFNQILHQKYGL